MSLALDGVLTLTLEGAPPLSLEGRSDGLSLVLPGLRSVGRLVPGMGNRSARAQRLEILERWLSASDLSLEITLRGRRIASLSRHTRATWLSRLLALGPVEVRARDLIVSGLQPSR